METKINKGKNNTYKIDVVIEKDKVNKAYSEALTHEAENAEIKGFRKGKAPLKVVKENVDPANLRSHALNHLLSDAYQQIIKENKLEPIVYPRFDIKEFEEDKDLSVEITVIERPSIKIGDYKKPLEKLGKDKKDDAITNQEILDIVAETSEVDVAEELIEEEVNRMMNSLMQQTQQLGITVDQYLQSQNKKIDDLREEYKGSAKKNIVTDFSLTEIAEKEGVTVTDEEVDMTINAIPDENSKKELEKPDQKMYIKAVLLKNKTIQKLYGYAKQEKKETKKDGKSKSSKSNKK